MQELHVCAHVHVHVCRVYMVVAARHHWQLIRFYLCMHHCENEATYMYIIETSVYTLASFHIC